MAVDTPEGLTARLQGAERSTCRSMPMGAAGGGAAGIPGRLGRGADHRSGIDGFEVESARGIDIRRDIARTVVNSGWGLLELRPMRMSLEDLPAGHDRGGGGGTRRRIRAGGPLQPETPGGVQ